MEREGFVVGDLEALRDQISDYYQTYYAELRSRLSGWDRTSLASLPEGLTGYKRIVTDLGQDGIVVTHWPGDQDSFDFHISPETPAKDLAAEQCGGERPLDYPPGSDFGTYEIGEPFKLVSEGQIVWVSGWTRMEITSNPKAWENTEDAREAARTALSPYGG
jgi:hypothetical protein